MRNILLGSLVALAGLMFLTPAVSAKRIAPPALADRIARADCIVVGKVTTIEEKTVKTPALGEMALAVVKIETGLLGAKGLTHVKVGFHPEALKVGQEACFFLTKVPGQAFFTAGGYLDVVNKAGMANFAQEVETIKRCTKLLEDPIKGLKSKEAGDRALAAALLVCRHGTPRHGAMKQEPIDAAESKLILETLAESDWDRFDPILRAKTSTVFLRLGLTPADGFQQPADFRQFPAAAKQWLKDNAGKYRVKRFTSEEK
jgi:hypothetical protein